MEWKNALRGGLGSSCAKHLMLNEMFPKIVRILGYIGLFEGKKRDIDSS